MKPIDLLQAKLDELILWCEQNTADDKDLAAVLQLVSVRIQQRGARAAVAGDRAMLALRSDALIRAGKSELSTDVATVDAAIIDAAVKG